LIPELAELIGPIVDPQGESFLTINSYRETPAFSPITLRIADEIASVAYL
jgi:hypothetical protein